jgi:hypothetical protein
VVGGWAQRPDGTIATELTVEVGDHGRSLIDEAIERVRSFVGDTRFSVRFPSPNQPGLLS